MSTDLQISSISGLLPQVQVADLDPSFAGTEKTSDLNSLTFLLQSDLAASSDRRPSFLGLLGLRMPGNIGDSEAHAMLLQLVSERLANDSAALRGSAGIASAGAILASIQENEVKIGSLEAEIQARTAERATVSAELTQAQGELQDLAAQEQALRSELEAQTVAGATGAVIAMLQAALAQITGQMQAKQTQISALNNELAQVDAGLVSSNDALVQATSLQGYLAYALLAQGTDRDENGAEADDFELDTVFRDDEGFLNQLDRMYRLSLEDEGLKQFASKDAEDRKTSAVEEAASRLVASLSLAVDVLKSAKDTMQNITLEPLQLTHDGRHRMQISL